MSEHFGGCKKNKQFIVQLVKSALNVGKHMLVLHVPSEEVYSKKCMLHLYSSPEWESSPTKKCEKPLLIIMVVAFKTFCRYLPFVF